MPGKLAKKQTLEWQIFELFEKLTKSPIYEG